ncbi:hypothetical protein JHK86_000784 [Glycine max]|nr:hypothetical protein JHK86_000784 [Glycine max]
MALLEAKVDSPVARCHLVLKATKLSAKEALRLDVINSAHDSLGLVARVSRRRVIDFMLFGESSGKRLPELIKVFDEGEDGGFGVENLFLLLFLGLAQGDGLFHCEDAVQIIVE